MIVLKILLQLKSGFHLRKMPDFLFKNVNLPLLNNDEIPKFTYNEEINSYSFGFLYPLKFKTKLYEAGGLYNLNIKCNSDSVANYIKQVLTKNMNNGFVLIDIEKKFINRSSYIHSIYTASPAVFAFSNLENQFWTMKNSNLDTLKTLCIDDLVKKLKHFESKNITTNLNDILSIEILSNKPLAFEHEKYTVFSHKMKIYFSQSSSAGELSKAAMKYSIGDKNYLGFGYCVRGMSD
ncbi:hypothetical protein HHI31_04970 [Campylobacter fetus subsp. venerealis]|uniref:hypothetical protein n=1 Tax=Campylobacter fetus TaxID=196 RepID=UPI0018E8E25E|nr:hypothetical protein [Campylobacter fetus]QQF52209.1 hypothetical protein HHI31_04970 [Campylobacter fetus subsp. venerealis]